MNDVRLEHLNALVKAHCESCRRLIEVVRELEAQRDELSDKHQCALADGTWMPNHTCEEFSDLKTRVAELERDAHERSESTEA